MLQRLFICAWEWEYFFDQMFFAQMLTAWHPRHVMVRSFEQQPVWHLPRLLLPGIPESQLRPWISMCPAARDANLTDQWQDDAAIFIYFDLCFMFMRFSCISISIDLKYFDHFYVIIHAIFLFEKDLAPGVVPGSWSCQDCNEPLLPFWSDLQAVKAWPRYFFRDVHLMAYPPRKGSGVEMCRGDVLTLDTFNMLRCPRYPMVSFSWDLELSAEVGRRELGSTGAVLRRGYFFRWSLGFHGWRMNWRNKNDMKQIVHC